MLHYPKINPIAFHIGPLEVHWYGIMLAGFCWCMGLGFSSCNFEAIYLAGIPEASQGAGRRFRILLCNWADYRQPLR